MKQEIKKLKREILIPNIFNLGRNREHRILEAKLDGHKLKDEKPKIDCTYYENCKVRIFGRIKCLFDYTQCSTYKSFEKYGEGFNEMYVGSKI